MKNENKKSYLKNRFGTFQANEFGKRFECAIPVTGVNDINEYLTGLLLENDIPFFFHRVGTFTGTICKRIDCYELMAVDGTSWTALYFDLFRDFTECRIPTGFVACTEEKRMERKSSALKYPEEPHFLITESMGSNLFVEGFPDKLFYPRFTNSPITEEELMRYFRHARPEKHTEQLAFQFPGFGW